MDVDFAKTRELLFQLKLSDIIRGEVITMTPDQRMSELRDILRDRRISGVPVMDGAKLLGMVSIEDVIRWLSEGGDDCPVAERMTPSPKTIFADQPLINAIKLFDQLGYGRFPVLDRDSGKLKGIITKGRIIEGMLRKLEKALREEELRQYRASHIFEDIAADYKEIYLTYDVVGKDFERAGTASTQMKRNLKRLGIRPDILHRLAIASYEAEMNVVIYADRGAMEYRITPEEVSLRIQDQGPGIEDLEMAVKPGYSTAADWVRELGFGAGMGLQNIKKCADRMDLSSIPGEGTTLKIRIFTRKNNETN